MLKKYMKTISAAALAAGIVFAAGAAPATAVMADELTQFDKPQIENDLKDVDLTGYGKNENGRHQLIDGSGFMEYAYSSDSTVAEDYFGIYFYVYNPTEREVSTRAGANVVNMAVSYDAEGEPTEYANCALTMLDCTDNHRFYKFKLTNSAAAYDRAKAYASAHDGVRRYDIAGIQLWFSGDANATDEFPLNTERGVTYRCTGFGKGCGADKEAESTLQIATEALTTIALDVHQTYYRMKNINQNGANHVNQVTSVYFSIPKNYTQKYGDLFSVKCEWDERRTTPILVTNNLDRYRQFYEYKGQSDPNINKDEKFGVYDTWDGRNVAGTPASEWGWGYQITYDTHGNVDQVGGVAVDSAMAPGWVFYTDESNILAAQITSEEMLNYANANGYANYLFAGDVDSGRTYGHQEHTFYADEPIDLLSFNSTAPWYEKFVAGWNEFWSFGKVNYDWGDGNTTVDPIKRVTDSDFDTSDALTAENLLVHKLDFEDFKAYYDEKSPDHDVFLLRFAATDYYAAQCTVATAAEWSDIGSWFTGKIDRNSTYMARETVFLDFDIIHLGFGDRDNLTIIPVVADPIDIIAGVDPPPVLNTVDWIFIAVLGAVVVACVLGLVLVARMD